MDDGLESVRNTTVREGGSERSVVTLGGSFQEVLFLTRS